MTPAEQAALLAFIAHFLTSAQVSGFASWIIEKLKCSQASWLKWINHETPNINKVVAMLTAILTTSGVSYTFDHTLGVFTLTGLTGANIATALWNVAKNYLMQHGWYKAVFETPQAQQLKKP